MVSRLFFSLKKAGIKKSSHAICLITKINRKKKRCFLTYEQGQQIISPIASQNKAKMVRAWYPKTTQTMTLYSSTQSTNPASVKIQFPNINKTAEVITAKAQGLKFKIKSSNFFVLIPLFLLHPKRICFIQCYKIRKIKPEGSEDTLMIFMTKTSFFMIQLKPKHFSS